jgi:hypothetical protein
MSWERERNLNSLSPHGLKEAQGHAARGVHDVNSVPCHEMGPGILGAPLNADPHRAGPKTNPYMPESSRRPVGEPTAITPPHNPAPHPYTPAAQVQERNTYGLSRVPRGASRYMRDNERGDTPAHERRESAAERRREGE